MTITPNTWYTCPESDDHTEYRLKVLEVHKETLLVVDEEGQGRIVNRIMFEADMKEEV